MAACLDFDAAFARLVGHEGGLSLDPDDRGNWTTGECGRGKLRGTKYGICAMSYPDEDIPALTLERAKAIYLRDFWTDSVPPEVRFDFFDMAVNSGRGAAVRALQVACGVVADGVLGPRTLAAAGAMPGLRLLARFNGARLLHMADAKSWGVHGRGWVRRVAANLLAA